MGSGTRILMCGGGFLFWSDSLISLSPKWQCRSDQIVGIFCIVFCDFHTDLNRLSSCHKCAPARGTRGLHKKQSPPCTSLQLFFSTKDTLNMHMATRAAALPQRLLHVGVGSEATVVPDATLARFGLTRTWARRRRRWISRHRCHRFARCPPRVP